MSYPPPQPAGSPAEPPLDPTRPFDSAQPPPGPPAPDFGPPPSFGPPPPGSPAAPPPGAAPAGPGGPAYGPPPGGSVFQPGVASPSYPPPAPQSTGYLPTSAYPAMPPPPVGKGAGGRGPGALLWVLIGVFAVLLCSGAAVAGVLAYQNATDDQRTATPATPSPPAGPTAEPTPDEPSPSPADSPSPGATGSGVVTYEITGTGTATITYSRVADRKTERVTQAELPWRITVPTPAGDSAYVVSVMAMRSSTQGEGKLTCRVLADGKELIERSSSSNRFASVFCIQVVQR